MRAAFRNQRLIFIFFALNLSQKVICSFFRCVRIVLFPPSVTFFEIANYEIGYSYLEWLKNYFRYCDIFICASLSREFHTSNDCELLALPHNRWVCFSIIWGKKCDRHRNGLMDKTILGIAYNQKTSIIC